MAERIIDGHARVAWARRSSDDRLLLFDSTDATFFVIVEPHLATLHEMARLTDREMLPAVDPQVGLESARLVHDGGARVVLADEGTEPRSLVLAAAMATGMAEAGRDASADHARERRQLGQPIGVHQAVKHWCADMAVRCEAALAQMLVAALRVEAGEPTASADALAAFVVAWAPRSRTRAAPCRSTEGSASRREAWRTGS